MPKILVADDNSNIQKMVALALKDLGIDVVSVGNGEAAVRKLSELHPDLVLADVFMPVRSGYEVCEFVKKDARFAHIPVILLVGAFDPLDEKEAQRVGADGVLKKPFVPPDPLIALVQSTLGKATPEHRAAQPRKPPEPPRPAPQEISLPQAVEQTIDPGIEEFSTRPAPIVFREDQKPTAFGELLEMPSTPASAELEPKLPEVKPLADRWRAAEEIESRETPGSTGQEAASETGKTVEDERFESFGTGGFRPPETKPEQPSRRSKPVPAEDTEETAAGFGITFPAPPWPGSPAPSPFTSPWKIAQTEAPAPRAESTEPATPGPDVIGLPHASELGAGRFPEALPGDEVSKVEAPSPEQAPLPLPLDEVEIPAELEETALREARAAAEAEAPRRGNQLDPAVLDALVQRVVSQLQPHILELVSQNVVRPVVTAILQRELDKKE